MSNGKAVTKTGNLAPGSGKARARRTTQPATTHERWLPQRKDFKTYQEWDTHTRAWQRIYALEDQVRNLRASAQKATEAATSKGAPSGAPGSGSAGSISATHILGIAVKAGVPQDGQVLTYKAAQGQFVFV